MIDGFNLSGVIGILGGLREQGLRGFGMARKQIQLRCHQHIRGIGAALRVAGDVGQQRFLLGGIGEHILGDFAFGDHAPGPGIVRAVLRNGLRGSGRLFPGRIGRKQPVGAAAVLNHAYARPGQGGD